MKANNITPSSPINFANGSKKLEQYPSMFVGPINILDINHINSPAGAATTTALPNTNKVLSNIDLIITWPICGFLYGGSSNAKDDGIPFSKVLDKNFDTSRVRTIPKIMIDVSIKADKKDWNGDKTKPVKNIVIIAISVGNRPLHGTKLFVKIAISLSLGESIILHPITPQALHPNPIHMVRDCLPWAHAFLKYLSMLNATLGRYPESSKSVNNGKKIAIGGSITETTHASVLYIPDTSIEFNHSGAFIYSKNIWSFSSIQNKNVDKISDG